MNKGGKSRPTEKENETMKKTTVLTCKKREALEFVENMQDVCSCILNSQPDATGREKINSLCRIIDHRNTLRFALNYGTMPEFRAELKKILASDMPELDRRAFAAYIKTHENTMDIMRSLGRA